MNFELKYLKYKNKYLQLKKNKLVGGNKRIDNEIREINNLEPKEYSNILLTKLEDEENKIQFKITFTRNKDNASIIIECDNEYPFKKPSIKINGNQIYINIWSPASQIINILHQEELKELKRLREEELLSDERVLLFKKATSASFNIPLKFLTVSPKRMIFASGDAYGGWSDKNKAAKDGLTNIEAFSKLGYNVFVCIEHETKNLEYLRSHPELNIVVCILIDDYKIDYDILRKLFKNSIDEFATDDSRFYPDSYTTFTILKKNGFVRNFNKIKIALGSEKDDGFGNQNFSYNAEHKQLTKISDTFRPT